MSPLQGLLKKDYRISRVFFLTWLGTVLLMIMAGFGLSAYTSQPAGTYPVIVIVGFSHFAFAPIMMFSLLNIETKNKLWLYTPQRGTTLLMSKLLVIFSYQIITQMILTIFAAISLYWFGRSVYDQISVNQFLVTIGFLNLGLMVISFYFTCWLTFYWTIYHALKRKLEKKLFRFICILLFMFIYNLIESLILMIKGFKGFIFQYKIEVFSDAILHYENENWSVLLDKIEIPVIPLVYYTALTILLFFMAASVLERKVEV